MEYMAIQVQLHPSGDRAIWGEYLFIYLFINSCLLSENESDEVENDEEEKDNKKDGEEEVVGEGSAIVAAPAAEDEEVQV